MREELNLETLDVTEADALLAGSLPMIHKDPFDRMLVAQAIRHNFTIVSADADVARYAVPVIRAGRAA